MKNRPLSPHLQIYKFQLTSILSILHRITGAVLYFTIMVSMWWIFSFIYYKDFTSGLLNCFIVDFVLVGGCFALYYHLFNGLRHLLADLLFFMDIKGAEQTGILVVILTIFSTILTIMI